jgi:hypothetical protein
VTRHECAIHHLATPCTCHLCFRIFFLARQIKQEKKKKKCGLDHLLNLLKLNPRHRKKCTEFVSIRESKSATVDFGIEIFVT